MSIYNSPSKLLKNHTKYNHDLNTFYDFSRKNKSDKTKNYKNNDINAFLGTEQFKKKLEKIKSFNPSFCLRESNQANIASKPNKILFSNYSIKDKNSNHYKSFNSDAQSNKPNESLTLIITSNKNLNSKSNNNNKNNKEINTDLNSNLNINANNNNFEIGGGNKIRKSKSSEIFKSLDLCRNKRKIEAFKGISNSINHNYKPIEYTKYSSLTSRNFAFNNGKNISKGLDKQYNHRKTLDENHKTSKNLHIEENRDIQTSRSLNCRSDGFSSKTSLQVKTKKFMINKNKQFHKAFTAKNVYNNNGEAKKESEKTLNCHHKKSVINEYFEKKESERNLFLNINKNLNENKDKNESELNMKRLNSAFTPGEDENKGFFLTSARPRPKEKEDGFFMLKKDYFIQTLIEKNNNNTNFINFLDELDQGNAQALIFKDKLNKDKHINFNKIKIENEFCKQENLLHINNSNTITINNKFNTINNNLNYNQHFNSTCNFFPTSIITNSPNKHSLEAKSKYRLKSSKNFVINKTSLIAQEKALDPKTFKETFSVRNFSNFKLIARQKQIEDKINFGSKGHRKEQSAGAYSQNSSNYMHFDNMSLKGRNCRSAAWPNNFNSNNNSFTKENQKKLYHSSKGKRYKDNYNENNYHELIELRSKSTEIEKKNASMIISRNNNFNMNLNQHENSSNSSSNVFYFDKASKLNYYHARELSAVSRGKRHKADKLSDLNNSPDNFRKRKGTQSTLNLKILHFKNGESTKKPLLTIRPFNFNDKLFSNDFIKGNFIRDKDSLGRGDSNNNDNDLNNQRLTIETLQERSKEGDAEAELIKISPENHYNQNEHENENENDKFNESNQDLSKRVNSADKSLSRSKDRSRARKGNIPSNSNPIKSVKKTEAQFKDKRKKLKITKAADENENNYSNRLSSAGGGNAVEPIGESNFHRIKKISINKNLLPSAFNKNKEKTDLDKEEFKSKDNVILGKEHFNTKKQIDELYELLSANKKSKSNAVEYAQASNSLTKHMNNKLINPNKSSANNDHNPNNNTANSRSRNKNNSVDKTYNNLNIKEEEIVQSSKDNNKDREALKDFLKANVYLDSDQFNFSSTNENLRKEDKDKSIFNLKNKDNNNKKYNKNKAKRNNLNLDANYYSNNNPRKPSAKVDRGFQSDFDYVTNQNLQNLRRLKIQSANNKLQSRNPYSSYNELKRINLNDFDLNEYLYSQNIDYQKIANFNLVSNKRTMLKSAIAFTNQRVNGHVSSSAFSNKPPPHSFRNVFTAGKIKLSTMILSNVKV